MACTCPTCGQPVDRPDPRALVVAISVPPAQRRILDRLAASFGSYVRTETLIEAIYFDDPTGGPLEARSVLKVHVSHLRKTIAPHGLTIEPAQPLQEGRGRRLTWAI
jgi:DNA-binding response OmpR family regulator